MRNPFRRRGEKALTASPAVLDAIKDGRVTLPQRLGGTNQRIQQAWEIAQSQSYGVLYQTQPAVRTVVDFLARNLAQLPLKCYERVDDNERIRRENHPAAQSLRRPFELTPPDSWLRDFIADFLVYANAYAVKFRGEEGRRILLPIKPHQMIVEAVGDSISGYRVWHLDGSVYPDRMQPPIAPENVIHWRDYNPADRRVGWSRLETLRNILAEESANQTANAEMLKSGLLKPGWVFRPIEAPDWSNEDRRRFEEDLYNRLTRLDKRPPTLEEGMELRDMGITPKDAEMLAGRRFTVEEVARVYGVPLGVLGLEPAGDLEQQQKQVYADVLPPYAKQLQGVFDSHLLQAEYGADDFYFEFDLNEKLRGDPVKRYAAITSAVGRPWMLVDEARVLENLPKLEGGDDLTIPLNVALGELPAPNVMPPQDPNGPPQDGSHREQPENRSLNGKAALLPPRRARADARRDRWAKEYEGVLRGNFERQFKTVKSSQGQKAVTDERWNSELATDLRDVSARHLAAEGKQAGFRLAVDFDASQGENWLAAKAQNAAEAINTKTQEHIEKDGAETAFAIAKEKRATDAGMGYATDVAAFAAKMATEQAPGRRMVTIDGGECEICAPYQGSWLAEDVPGWPSYHPSCNCVADPS